MTLKITSNDIDHLSWIFSRMKSVHGESENLDYMHLFREIIDNLRSDYSCVESKVETPEEKEALDAIEQPKRTKVVYEEIDVQMMGSPMGQLINECFVKTDDWVSISNIPLNKLYQYKIYRRIEKPVDWRDELNDYINDVSDRNEMSPPKSEMIGIKMKVSMTYDQWCDFARIILEQEGE